MKKWLSVYFGFSKRECNGLLFLIILCIFVTIAPQFYRYYIGRKSGSALEESNEKTALQKLLLVDKYNKKKYGDARDYIEGSFGSRKKATYFKFDPNLIGEKEWQSFGLSPKQAMSIVNYVKKGGKFYKPEDLKRMYTISPEKYEALLPYVEIKQTEQAENWTKTSYPKKEVVVVEINAADTLELDKIKGVGSAFARRIVRYRERVGGFYKKEQLLEVFGVDTAKYNEIKDQIKVDAADVKKIAINKVEFDDLKRNPYLTFKQMNAIIQYRKQHGAYKSIADLNKVILLNPQVIEKIAPYLDFN